MRTLVTASLFLLLAPGVAWSQEPPPPEPEPRAFVAVYGIGQRATSTSTTTLQFSIYEETGAQNFSQKFGRGAGFWIEGGYRVWQNVHAGLAFSQCSGESTGSVTMTVPHPLLFDAPRTGTRAIDGAKQRVQGVHVWAGWRLAIRGPLDLLVSAGPSFVSVSRDVANITTFSEGNQPFTAIEVDNPTTVRRSKSTVGANVGATVGVRLTRLLGATGLVRYVYAKPNIQGVVGSSKAAVGGLTFGGGLRLSF